MKQSAISYQHSAKGRVARRAVAGRRDMGEEYSLFQ